MLSDSYKLFVTWASGLGDYQSLTKTQLANGYCDADEAGDEVKRNQYYAALMLRYWYKVYEFADTCKFMRQTKEEFVSWVGESLDIGLHYRKWRDPSNKLYNDPNGPDKVFQRCFKSTRQRWYSYVNKDIRRASYLADSIDRQEGTFKDGADYLEDSGIIFNEIEEKHQEDCIREVIQHFIDKGDLIGAIILDCIAFQDSYIDVNKNGESYSQFSQSKLTRTLVKLGDWYTKQFIEDYFVDEDKLKQTVTKMTSSCKPWLNKHTKRILEKAKNDEVVRSTLCY